VGRFDDLVEATTDLRVLKYAVIHLGEGVRPGSQNKGMIIGLRQHALHRYYAVIREAMDPRLRKQKIFRDIIQWQQEKFKRLATARWQLQLDLEKLATLEKTEQLELFLRHIHLQGTIIVGGKLKRLRDMARETPDVLRRKMKDINAETRWMAIQVVGIKLYPLEKDLITRLKDRDNSVRQAARLALIRISRGNDFGPAVKAGASEREKAIARWRQWWSLQDSNPRQQIPRLIDQAREEVKK
jgi:hypothetical protein